MMTLLAIIDAWILAFPHQSKMTYNDKRVTRSLALQLMGRAYSDEQLEQVVANTLREFDADCDNKLNYEEFKQLLSHTDLVNKFALAL